MEIEQTEIISRAVAGLKQLESELLKLGQMSQAAAAAGIRDNLERVLHPDEPIIVTASKDRP